MWDVYITRETNVKENTFPFSYQKCHSLPDRHSLSISFISDVRSEMLDGNNFKAVIFMYTGYFFVYTQLHFFFSFSLVNMFRTEIALFIHIFLYFLLTTSFASLCHFFMFIYVSCTDI